MKYHVQFLTTDLAGNLVAACGSDAVFILDGRKSLSNMVADAKERQEKLAKVHPHYVEFQIMLGDRFENCREFYSTVSWELRDKP